MSETITGSCLCGAVGYAIRGPQYVFQYCHCSRCRKFTGSAHSAAILVSPDHFEWTAGEENVGYFPLPGARDYATSFCRRCGSSLPWKSQTGRSVVVPAGTLDDDPGTRPTQNIYWGSRAAWRADDGELPCFDELPPRNK